MYRLRRKEKGIQVTERTLKTGMGSWWRVTRIYRANSFSLRTTRDRGEPGLQHYFELKCDLALEWRKSDESPKIGIQGPETDCQTKDEGRRLGGIQEKNFEGDDGNVEEDEIANDGRKGCREGVEDHGLGYL